MKEFKEFVMTVIMFILGFLGYQYFWKSGKIGVSDAEIKKSIDNFRNLSDDVKLDILRRNVSGHK